MASSLVIKVKHGESLRRFSSTIDETGKLDLDMYRLRKKIICLFNFHPVADLTLTYTDEDGDLISLVDEDDLQDIMKQSLNPLRITVKLNGSFSPMTSLGNILQVSPNLKTNFCEILRSVPESFYEALSKLPLDLAYEAVISAIAEIIESFTKMKGNYMNPLQMLQKNDRRTSETSPKINISGQRVENASGKTGLDMSNRVIHRKLFQSTLPDHQYSNKIQNTKDSKPVATSASGIYSKAASFGKDSVSKSGASKLPCEFEQWKSKTETSAMHAATAIATKANEDGGGYKCARCQIKILSGPKKGEDTVCKMCVKIASIKIRGYTTKAAYIPSMLNRVRLQRLDSSYLGDLSCISDGTVLAPSTRFTKIWKLRNNGLDSWPPGTIFRMVEGDALVHEEIESLKHGLLVGRELAFAVTFIAPRLPGQYVSFWSVTAFGEPFGQFAPVFIQVADKINYSSSVVSSASRISELGSGKNGGSTSLMSPKTYLSSPKVGHEKHGISVEREKLLKAVEKRNEIQKSKAVLVSKESKPVISSAGGTYFENTSPWKSGGSVMTNSGRAASKESENLGGCQCTRCRVQLASGCRYIINDDSLCKRCLKDESRKIRSQAYTPSRLNHVRLRKINSALIDQFSNVSDGAVLAPSTPFTKIWRMRNTGSGSWPKGTKFTMVDGDIFSNTKIVPLEIPENGLPVGKEIDIVVNFIAPEFPGQYVSFWHVTAFGTPIGMPAVAFIQVAAPLKDGESNNTSETAPKVYSSGQKADDEKLGAIVKNSSEGVKKYDNMRARKEVQNVEELPKFETPCIGKSGPTTTLPTEYDCSSSSESVANETTNVGPAACAIPAEESECVHCGVQMASGCKSKIIEGVVCAMCFEVENRVVPHHPRVPSRLDQARLRKINSSLIGDFSSVSNGAVLAPSTAFTKIWRMRNNGSDSWPKGTKFTMVGGDAFSNTKAVILQIPDNGLPVGSEIYISVDFVAPELPGKYMSFWHVTAFGMPIGQPAVAFIQVAAPHQEDDKSDKLPAVDLNAPVEDCEVVIELNASPESGNSCDSSCREVVIDLNASPESENSDDGNVSTESSNIGLNVSPELDQSLDIQSHDVVDDNTQKLELPAIESPAAKVPAMEKVETTLLNTEGTEIDKAGSSIDLNLLPGSGSDDEHVQVTVPDTKEVILDANSSDNQELDSSSDSNSDDDEKVVNVSVSAIKEAMLNANGNENNQERGISTESSSDDEAVHVSVTAAEEVNDNLGCDVSSENTSSDDEVVHVKLPAANEVVVTADGNDNLGRDVSSDSTGSDDEVVHVTVPASEEVAVTANGNDTLESNISADSSSSDDEVVHVKVAAAAATKEEEVLLKAASGNDNQEHNNISTFSDSDEELVHVNVPVKGVIPNASRVNNNQDRSVSTFSSSSSSDDELFLVTLPVPPRRKFLFW